MTSPTRGLTGEDLAQHAEWLQRLARALVGGGSEADDIAQATWERALQGGQLPRAGGWRPFLARLARGLARDRRRSESRRRRRERAAAGRDEWPSAGEIAARVEVGERLAQALRELDEARRTVVVLRYFEGHSSAEIARRLCLPAATVRSRLKRGLSDLRVRLGDDEGEGSSVWSTLVLWGESQAATVVGGVGLMSMAMKAAAAAAVAAGAAWWLWSSEAPEPPAGVQVGSQATRHEPPLEPPPLVPERSPQGAAPVAAAARIDLRGELRLFDWNGERVEAPSGYVSFHVDDAPQTAAWLEGGAWTATVAPGVLTIDGLTLSGCVAVPRRREFAVAASGGLVLEADVPRGNGLRVVDGGTGVELSGVTVVAARESSDLVFSVPPLEALERPVVQDGVSPVLLPEQGASWSFWVGAPPRYAWRSITIVEGQSGRARTVALRRAGGLLVELGPEAPEPLSVALRRAADLDYVRRPVAPGAPVTIEGIAPGEYRARLVSASGRLLDERRVAIAVGEVTRIVWRPPTFDAEIRGSLDWPVANADIVPNLTLSRVGLDGRRELLASKPVRSAADGSSIDWSFGRQPPGRYSIEVEPIQQQFPLTIDEAEPDPSWSIPGAEVARVTLRASSAGETPATQLELFWSRLPDRYSPVARTGEGAFSFACAPGPIRVAAVDPRFEVEYQVRAGPNELVLPVPRPSTAGPGTQVTLRFQESGVTIPVDIDPFHPNTMGVQVLTGRGAYLGPTGEVSGLASRFSAIDLRFSGPGVYVFDLPKLEGYRATGPLRIRVSSDPGQVVEVELVPEP